jgi:hypothetical protein
MLTPVAGTPGLWRGDGWAEGQPGLFVAIIGVSAYEHLENGPAPAPATFGLGQLAVSALTGYRFFEWLARGYSRQGVPVAQCWMLLAPTAEELAFEPAMRVNTLAPTLANCEDAIGQWYASMSILPAAAAVASRSMFLFSGHGLEIFEDKQLLLPSDYLRPPLYSVNNALSTLNLARGLKALKVPRHFFFLDACRNDHDSLGNYSALDGKPVLNELKNSLNNPDCLVPLLYASAAGNQAFQPTNPAKGGSLFGSVLLEGLRAQGLQPDCGQGVCVVDLNRLEPFVRNRLVAVMRDEYGATSFQKIRLRGDHVDDPVTEVPAPPGPAATRLTALITVADSMTALRSIEFGGLDSSLLNLVISPHELFGSEWMTEIWTNQSRIFDVKRKRWLPKGTGFLLDRVERDESTRTYAVDMRVENAQPDDVYWFQLTDPVRTFGCFLPEDRSGNTKFRFELDFEFEENGKPRHLSRLDATLSPENKNFLGWAAALWSKYENVGAAAAAKEIVDSDALTLELLLEKKMNSPVAAMVGGLILLRARRWDKLHDWVRNLANWFPSVPDAAVLWTEQCMQQAGAPESQAQALDYLLRLFSGPLPFFGETLGYAARQAHVYQALGGLDAVKTQVLKAVQFRVSWALGSFRAGGLFASFAGPERTLLHSLRLPPG